MCSLAFYPLQWRHNEHDGVSSHRCLLCLLNCWFSRRSKKISKLRVTGLCTGNSPVTSEFPAQKVSNAENVSTARSGELQQKRQNSALLTPVRGFLSQRANYTDILFHVITSSCISIRLFVRLFKGGPLPGPKITFWHLSSPCQQLTSPIKPETPRWRAWHHMQQANSEVQVRMSETYLRAEIEI